MDEVKGGSASRQEESGGIPGTVVYRLGTLGTIAADRFAAAIEPLNLKPKHVGLMASLAHAGAPTSQQELAGRLGVVPSLVVSLADHLEDLGAVQRVRDPADRRRQSLTLTDQGRTLLTRCTATARELDKQFTAALKPTQRKALQEALAVLAAEAGLPAN